MNEQLQDYARTFLKEGLLQCSESQRLLFRRMYAKGHMDLSTNNVVDFMDPGKLDWAMQQVQRTLDKNK